MFWLIVTRIAISTLLGNNGTVSAGPETTITPMTSIATCQMAATAVQSHAVGTYRVFADCVAQ